MPNVITKTILVSYPEVRSYSEKEADGQAKLIRAAIVDVPVTVTVDFDKLAHDLGSRAISGKSGKSVEAGGAVVVKRI